MLSTPDKFDAIDRLKLRDETALLRSLIESSYLSAKDREAIVAAGAELVRKIRQDDSLGLMEVFLAEYGLSTEEGIALMCLAEALLRVPDAETIDDLIEDKIVPHNWASHRGQSKSSLVNTSTLGLALTGRVLEGDLRGPASIVRSAVKRLGEPVIRAAVAQGMREMGRQFVLGETIKKAMARATRLEAKGFTYSYDMLGEAAMTAKAASFYFKSYANTIDALAPACTHADMRNNPGVSVKLSALHPRYEVAQEARVMKELVPALKALALKAKAANMNLNIDAEEADRLTLSLKVIERVLEDTSLAGWDGFGVVVQAYSRRAGPVLDWLYDTAARLDRRITVRLVKGAYWDAEVKHAQVEGLEDFPVFTRKAASDVSYISNARKLLGMTDRIYPQFATHNAHTIAAVLHMASGQHRDTYEFQRLHGMGEKLHELVMQANGTRCRIYAPVGAHRDLLAYLVRRLLENGANSSFVNQIVDERIAPEKVTSCPFDELEALDLSPSPSLPKGPAIFGTERRNSRGFDINNQSVLHAISNKRVLPNNLYAHPLIAGEHGPSVETSVRNPATGAVIGKVLNATSDDIKTALEAAKPWNDYADHRATVLKKAADLYEAQAEEFFAILAVEAGKTLKDAVGEVREAVDFLRYYADMAATAAPSDARGLFTCISPWNFPLAIFTGQIAAALATGNGVLAKPAEQTSLIAYKAVKCLHDAGVPVESLQLLPGRGGTVGAELTGDARINGVAFTGSTETAKKIRHSMARAMAPDAPLIAETGGLNAMIVDSTALPEQAVRDIAASAFQSAGQRCSALRCLYVQEDIANDIIEMIEGVMDELVVGDPWALKTDVGPVIDESARQTIADHVEVARLDGRLLKQVNAPEDGTFVGPALIRVNGIRDLQREIFGPVLHVATYRAGQIDKVIEAINATGYGLTFGLHTRINSRIEDVTSKIHVGNIYVNRNQIGAVVGSQPFGGEGLSGTGPKAGGPNYLTRFTRLPAPAYIDIPADASAQPAQVQSLQKEIDKAQPRASKETVELPGPTGESNRLTMSARPPLLCLGPGTEATHAQVEMVEQLGGTAVPIGHMLTDEALIGLDGFSGVVWWGNEEAARTATKALALRKGPILPLIGGKPDKGHVVHERHVCVDTTAAGGNAALLAESAQMAGKV